MFDMRAVSHFLALLLFGVALNPTVVILVPGTIEFMEQNFEEDLATEIWLWSLAVHVIGFSMLAGHLVVQRWTFNLLALMAMGWCIYAISINASIQSLENIGTFSTEPVSFTKYLINEWRFAAVVLVSLLAGIAIGQRMFSRKQMNS